MINFPMGFFKMAEVYIKSDLGLKIMFQCCGFLYISKNVYNEKGIVPKLLI